MFIRILFFYFAGFQFALSQTITPCTVDLGEGKRIELSKISVQDANFPELNLITLKLYQPGDSCNEKHLTMIYGAYIRVVGNAFNLDPGVSKATKENLGAQNRAIPGKQQAFHLEPANLDLAKLRTKQTAVTNRAEERAEKIAIQQKKPLVFRKFCINQDETTLRNEIVSLGADEKEQSLKVFKTLSADPRAICSQGETKSRKENIPAK